MAIDEIHDKAWRIEVLQGEPGWKTLIYQPSSPLHEATVPHGPDRRAVLAQVKALIDRKLTS